MFVLQRTNRRVVKEWGPEHCWKPIGKTVSLGNPFAASRISDGVMSSRGLGHSCFNIALAIAVHLSTGVAWLCSSPIAFLSRYSMFHIPNFLGSPLRLWLYSYSFLYFPLRSCLQGPDSVTHCLAAKILFWCLQDPTSLVFCMPAKPASHGLYQSLPQF